MCRPVSLPPLSSLSLFCHCPSVHLSVSYQSSCQDCPLARVTLGSGRGRRWRLPPGPAGSLRGQITSNPVVKDNAAQTQAEGLAPSRWLHPGSVDPDSDGVLQDLRDQAPQAHLLSGVRASQSDAGLTDAPGACAGSGALLWAEGRSWFLCVREAEEAWGISSLLAPATIKVRYNQTALYTKRKETQRSPRKQVGAATALACVQVGSRLMVKLELAAVQIDKLNHYV
ncbi:hypothetical protein JZ751_009167 [Albula glossodonta]|uniref:Uncharacterized protein n=1 Tax=Albula glossodonta TaxID=121402 RepID=A0A8T2N0X6_9TELE|nr:hypothetical protein JZ751_009167 [Albula glossodonta]